MDSDFRPSLFRQGKVGFKSLFKKLVSKEDPMKRPRKENVDLPGYVNLDNDDNEAHVKDWGSSKSKECYASPPPISKGKERVPEECDSNQIFEGQVSSLFNGMNNYLSSSLQLHVFILRNVQVSDYYKFLCASELNSDEAHVNTESLFYPPISMDKSNLIIVPLSNPTGLFQTSTPMWINLF